MSTLGMREAWLDATARHPEGPAVRFSSCFPFQGDTAFIVPPRSIWPPIVGVSAARTRWKSARFIPLPLVAAILGGQPPHEGQWTVDGASECLLPAGQLGPFRANVRWSAAIDRLNGNAERHSAGVHRIPPRCRVVGYRFFCRRCGPRALGRTGARCAKAAGGFRIRRGTLARLGTQRPSRSSSKECSPIWCYRRCVRPLPPSRRSQSRQRRIPTRPNRPLAPSPPRPRMRCPEPEAATTQHWLLSLFTPGSGRRRRLEARQLYSRWRAVAASTAPPDSASARNNCKW